MIGQSAPAAVKGLEPGTIFAGKYRIERVLGAGGMGVVVVATHLHLDERVAIKVVLPEIAQNEELVARFLREGRNAVKIKGEHVVRVFDVGRAETGVPYMVMEYLEGEDLAHLLERSGPLPVAEAVDAVLQACEAIAQAHALGIVHRDLKPANLFATNHGDGELWVKVLDFGIAVRGADSDVRLTRTHAVIGSPSYMAPEQLMSARMADARSDIWSLGVTLYELISGRLPFEAETMTGLAVAITTAAPVPIKSLRKVPGGLAAAIHRCLAKNADERFATIAELCVAMAPFGSPRARGSLERIRASRWITSESGAPSARAAYASRPPPARVVETKDEESGGGVATAILSLLALALIGGGGYLVWQAANRPLTPAEATTTPANEVSELAATAPSVTPTDSLLGSASNAAPPPSSSVRGPAPVLSGKKRVPGQSPRTWSEGAPSDYNPYIPEPYNPPRELTGEELDNGHPYEE